jgi:hypothetical protein
VYNIQVEGEGLCTNLDDDVRADAQCWDRSLLATPTVRPGRSSMARPRRVAVAVSTKE